jgi:hypothetical protein
VNDLYHGFVYLWENTHPEAKKYKKYIGQHVGTIDDGYIGSGKIFRDSFFSNKYHGHWKRSILEFCNTQEELNQAEARHIQLHDALNDDQYCNLREGGSGGKMHPESCRKMSIAKKGKTPWNKGIPMTETARQKLKASLKGRKVWNKGLKGCYKLSSRTKQKIQQSKSIFYNNKRERDYNLIIEFVKINGYVKREHVKDIINSKGKTTIVSDRLNKLIKQNKLKKLYYSKNDIRYVLPQFSLEDIVKNSIIAYIKDHPRCQAKDIKAYVASMCNVTTSRVRLTLKGMVTKKQIIKEQGYKTQHYTFNI